MGDIVKVMRMDFITSAGSVTANGKGELILGIPLLLLFLAMPLFLSPLLSFYLIFAAMVLVIPLQNTAKGDLGHLYGILPVKRGNITRARFAYIFLIYLVSELVSFLIAWISILLNLNRLLPDDSALVEIGREYYDSAKLPEIGVVFVGFTMFFCFMFSFMEMMGQIHGRENEMKILFIFLAGIVVVVLGFTWLASIGIIPYMDFSGMSEPEAFPTFVIIHLVVGALCVLFSEITAAKMAAREL